MRTIARLNTNTDWRRWHYYIVEERGVRFLCRKGHADPACYFEGTRKFEDFRTTPVYRDQAVLDVSYGKATCKSCLKG